MKRVQKPSDIMKNGSVLVVCCILLSNLFLISVGEAAGGRQDTIDALTVHINNAQSKEERAEYLVFRARNYIWEKKFELALADFSSALDNDNKDWIQLERCKLLMVMERYGDVQEISSDLLARQFDPNGETSYYNKVAKEELAKRSEGEMPLLILLPPIDLSHNSPSNYSHYYCHNELEKLRAKAGESAKGGLTARNIDAFLEPKGKRNPYAGLVEGRIVKKYASFSTSSPFVDFNSRCITEVFRTECSDYTIKKQRTRVEHRKERQVGRGASEWLELRGYCTP